ncbi:MAG: starch-binding protein, partial [Spirochaetales bacterium]|nr:starch-binding protein [Spirochaetales bacterium]
MIMILMMSIVGCSNENVLTGEQNNITNENDLCSTTIIVAIGGRGWTPALYRLTATNTATNEVINVPDSNVSRITYEFKQGTYLFEIKAFDEKQNLIYRGKTEITLNAAAAECEVFALKNSGNISVDLSDYAESVTEYNKIRVTASRETFETVGVDADFYTPAIFQNLAVGDWLFTVYSVNGTDIKYLGSETKTVIADIITNVTVKYQSVTTTSSSTTVSSTTTSSTSSTTTSSTTTTIPFDGYRVHVYGENWSNHYVYYYNSGTQNCGNWPGKMMLKSSDDYYFDMTNSWVEPGKTMVIFYGGESSGSDRNNRYPLDGVDGVVFPSGVKEAWFNIGTKQWAVSNPFSTDPTISISPAGNVSFSGSSQSVSITANKYCTTTKYTTDGTDPSSSNTATSFSGSTTISVGSSLSIGQSVTVKVYGTDGNQNVTAEATYTKTDKPATPTRLGAYYTSSATSFSIWSPDSSNVTVTVTPKNGTSKTYTCTAGFTVDGGYSDTAHIYGVTVPGDLHLAEYQFKIGGKAVRDPYGKMVKYENEEAKTNQLASGTENGYNYTSYAGSSVNIVVDMDVTSPTGGWADRPVLENRCDAIVYEVHIADFTSHSSWNGTAANKGKFPGMVESGTTYSGVKTGLDHLKELGVTHVQILPMYDFATKYNTTLNDIYNWGYDPVNYNVPEDRYSTCPSDYVERIREVKNMINEFHKAGIRVIMDVVYNHTFDKEMFKNISSKYYTTTDLSGCGNSINTGIDMVSRFIRDSLEYWTEEYNIDGFRFDLLGIYHTSAVKSWGEYLNNTKFPDRTLLMYGEPWNGYASDNESVKVRMSAVAGMSSGHIGVFNGKYRESLKGSNDDGGKGYIFNSTTGYGASAYNVSVGLRGSGTSLGTDSDGYWTRFFTVTPDQSINYMFAHDNLCCWDKIKKAGVTGDYAKRIVKFGHGILLVSQGIPFIHAGDEFLRTKEKGAGSAMSHNSYMAGTDTNSIDWGLKATNKAIFQYHADLIALRKAHDGLRYRNGVGTTETSGNAVKYYVTDKDGTKLCIVVNPGDNIAKPVSGTTIFDINGSSPSSTQCEGTAVTIIRY